MKGAFRKVSSIMAILFLCLAAVPLQPANRAEGAGVLPRALPDSGVYSQKQNVVLTSEAGASISFSVYGRATLPDELWGDGAGLDAAGYIPIEEDVVLSVSSTEGGVTTQKDFSYTINPSITSTYPANGAVNAPRRPTIAVVFSREMRESVLENEDNITITKTTNSQEVDRNNFTVDYTPGDNTLRVNLTVDLDAASVYTVALKNMVDSNGKALQGMSSFAFTTAASTGYATYGTIATDQTYYDNTAPQDTVQISGSFIQDGQEVTANPLVPALQIQVVDPDGVVDSTINVTAVTSGSFGTTYSVPNGARQGNWTLRLYDNGSPRQFLASCNFSVGSVAAPVADKISGTYFEPIVVSLTTATSGASIYYTTDDAIPDGSVGTACTLYQGPISISQSRTLRAVAVKGGVKSSLLTLNYTIDNILGVLTFVPARVPGNHPTGVTVNTQVSVTFGRAVQVDTVKVNFSLIECDLNHDDIPNAYVPGTVSYDSLNRKATFTPSNPLKSNTHYRGILGTGITDLSGTHISASVDDDWFFETGTGQDIQVDGVAVTGNYITVNKNPVTITVTSADASLVTVNGGQATSIGNGQFIKDVSLSTGNNTVTIVVTDTQSVSRTSTIAVNYLNLLQVGAAITAVIPAKGKLELFDKQLSMEFPKGVYLKDTNGLALNEQAIVFTVFQNTMPDGFPSVSFMYDIQPKTAGADLNNKGESTITFYYDKYVSASSGASLTVLCDTDGDGTWEENLGGKVDTKKRTITVPFGAFGRYVVVNKVWTFTDYTSTGWARIYVEYLWSKGIMKPLSTAGTGQFGLTDSLGQEVPITRGEFAVMMGKSLGLNKANYINYGIFTDLRLTGTSAYAKDQDGYWRPIDDADYKYVDMLARNGILNGSLDMYGNLCFNYHSVITREEVAVILARAMNLAVESDDGKVRAAITKMYTDANSSISAWAQPFVLAASKGYFGGFPDKTFKGQDNFTRPQAARIVYQTMKKAKLM